MKSRVIEPVRSPMDARFRAVSLLLVDIDGTLTDATIYWGGPSVGWTQRFSVRDGEAIRRLTGKGVPVVPLSRNPSVCAKTRIEGLGLPTEWLGVSDKLAGLEQIVVRYAVHLGSICYVADGREDVPVLQKVGLPCAVADAHTLAKAAAKYVTTRRGGDHALEEIADLIWEARGWPA
jgi:3-deoxy-D-manno-octulosonate 8-phosphate phosphatase (KDO 8-P phosphatase)